MNHLHTHCDGETDLVTYIRHSDRAKLTWSPTYTHSDRAKPTRPTYTHSDRTGLTSRHSHTDDTPPRIALTCRKLVVQLVALHLL